MGRTSISQTPFDLIITEEITSGAYYEKMYRHPEWPGGKSGVTVGVGYDLGYATVEEIAADWGNILSYPMVRAMQRVAGITGTAAKGQAAALRGTVDITLDQAMEVFKTRDIPKWIKIVEHALPNTDKLPDDAFGAILSLSFNHGASGFHLVSDHNREMNNILGMMQDENFEAIPDEIRAMKRLWPTVQSLRVRRDKEADMFEQSLPA